MNIIIEILLLIALIKYIGIPQVESIKLVIILYVFTKVIWTVFYILVEAFTKIILKTKKEKK